MLKISIYVEAGWDEAEELIEKLADLMADRGYGIPPPEDHEEFESSNLKSIITLSDAPEDDDDQEELAKRIITDQRLFCIPREDRNKPSSADNFEVPDFGPDEFV